MKELKDMFSRHRLTCYSQIILPHKKSILSDLV